MNGKYSSLMYNFSFGGKRRKPNLQFFKERIIREWKSSTASSAQTTPSHSRTPTQKRRASASWWKHDCNGRPSSHQDNVSAVPCKQEVLWPITTDLLFRFLSVMRVFDQNSWTTLSSGGNTKFTWFWKRLYQELAELFDEKTNIKVRALPNKETCWVGLVQRGWAISKFIQRFWLTRQTLRNGPVMEHDNSKLKT